MVVTFILLLLILWAYRALAVRLKFGAPITDRSSHTRFIPTGGGIIVLIATIIFAITYFYTLNTPQLIIMACAFVLGLTSLADDIRPLPPVPRLLLQILAVGLSFKQLFYAQAFDIYMLILFCGVGCINAFNFIDGIAGMLVLLSIVVIGTMMYAINYYAPDQTVIFTLLEYLMISVLALAIFNVPDRLFAGDVGAITIGFFISYILITLILATRNAALSIFVIVPVFDTGFTTLQRLFAGENILLPHRKCIYQILTSAWHLPHLTVSVIYALLQLLINALFFLIPQSQQFTYFIVVISLLTISYFAIRQSPLSKKYQ